MKAHYGILAGLLALSVFGPGCQKSESALELPANAATAPASSIAVPSASGAAAAWAGSGPSGSGADAPLSGTTEAHRKSTLSPKVGSTVARVYVREGDFVKAGQVLVSLETRDFSLRQQNADAMLDAAKVNLDATELEWNRLKSLTEENAIPKAQFDQIDARYKAAKAQVAQAQAGVDMGKKALVDTSIVAPYNGVIVRRHVNEGEYAAMMPPTPVITIEEDDPIDLRIQVPSVRMNEVHAGDEVNVLFPANAKSVVGKIARIVPANDPRTRTFSAIVELPNSKHELRSGLYAEVTPGAAQATSADPAKPARSGNARPRVIPTPAADVKASTAVVPAPARSAR